MLQSCVRGGAPVLGAPRLQRRDDLLGCGGRPAAAGCALAAVLAVERGAAAAGTGAGGEVAVDGAHMHAELLGDRAHRFAGGAQRHRGRDALAARQLVLDAQRREPGGQQRVAPGAEVVDDGAGARPARVLGEPARRPGPWTGGGRGPLVRARRAPHERRPVAQRDDDRRAVPAARVHRANLARHPSRARAPGPGVPRRPDGHAGQSARTHAVQRPAAWRAQRPRADRSQPG